MRIRMATTKQIKNLSHKKNLYKFPSIKSQEELDQNSIDLIHSEIGEVRESQGRLSNAVEDMHNDLDSIKKEIGGVKEEESSFYKELKSNINSISNEVTEVKTDVTWIKKLMFISITASLGTLTTLIVMILKKALEGH